ncbi:MAG: ECF transporter S component [Euryarchaeota archaeon]|nr:ECF transporter S component [Euryarchaeota archaeon]
MKATRIIRIALYVVLVFVATIILQIYTPSTGGYFNLGEAAIYSIAIISAPLEAGIAAGLGASLADLVTGYGYFAPGTLVIKFLEGFLVSFIYHRITKYRKRISYWISIMVSLITGGIIAVVGYYKLSGVSEISSVPVSILGVNLVVLNTKVTISEILWIIIGIVIASVLIYATIIKGKENLTLAASMIVGVLIMPFGYFLYEFFYTNPIVLGLPAEQAFVEIPVNIAQALTGMALAMPIVVFLREAGGTSD